MKKDVIYIDLEDDITAIIGKVKSTTSKIVALVPPKRTGMLQSAVNLKLLQKSALEDGKRLVLITSDKSLISLAAGIKIPVAKNLQSKPEIPLLPDQDTDDNEVINGAELPVGEFAQSADNEVATSGSQADEISSQVDFADKPTPAPGATPSTAKKSKNGGLGSKIKVPNFNIFRKRLFLIAAAVIVLGGFLVWALVVAPSATITINAKTSAVNIDRVLTLTRGDDQSKPSELQLKPETQQIKKTTAVEFDATGKKQIGEKASGQVTLSNADDSDPVTVPAGTAFTAASGQKFTSSTGATVPGAKVASGQIQPGKATVTITAADIGPEYNVAAQSYAVAGKPNLGASGQKMEGGTREEVTVVSQADVDKAKQQLAQQDVNAVKDELRKKFDNRFIVIEESFMTAAGDPSVNPAVDQQAQKAKLTVETTYTLLGLVRDEVKQVLEDVLNDALDGKPDQSVFSDGSNTIKFESFQKLNDNSYSARLVTTGYIGTTIDTKALAEQVKGKRYGEIEQIVNQIPGVDKVDIKFSPFWVNSAPGNTDKITIRFTVVNETQ